MSSRSGMMRADIDVMLMHDPKVVRLARLQGNPERTAMTVMLYVATVLASWREDRPMNVEESAPAWFLLPLEPHSADLIAVGLLEPTGYIPADTLTRWMAGVRAVRAGGAAGAAKRWGGNRGPLGEAMPRLASQPASQPETGGKSPGERTGDPRSLKAILHDMGAEPFKGVQG